MSEDKSSALYDDIVTVNSWSIRPSMTCILSNAACATTTVRGVIAGITNISNVHGYMMNEGDKVPVEGKLTFRGYDIYEFCSSRYFTQQALWF